MNQGSSSTGIGRIVLRAVAGLAITVVGAVLLLQIDGIATRILPAAGRFLPWENATLQVEHASISGLSRLRTRDLRITDQSGRLLLSVDSADLSFRPISLLAGRIDILGLRASGIRAIARQSPDSSWDLVAPFRRDTTAQPASEPMAVRIRWADISDVVLTGYYAGEQDSLRIDDLRLRLGNLRTGEGLAFTLDTLNARVTAPGRARPAEVSGRARLSEGQLTVQGFRLQSDSSDVYARGNLVLPGPTAREIRNVDFKLEALPLDFRDVAPLLPALRLPASIRLEARVTGRSSLLQIDATGRTSDGATLSLDGVLTPDLDGPVRYELQGEIRNLDPGMLGLRNSQGRTSAVIEVDLAGDSLAVLDGTATVRLDGLDLGDVELSRSQVVARFEKGAARYRLEGALLPWMTLVGDGTLRLFQDTPTYDLHLTLSQSRAWPDSGPLRVQGVTAVVQARGSGFSASEREGRASIRVAGRIGEATMSGGRGEARWQANRATAHLTTRLAGDRPVADSLGADLEWRNGIADLDLAFASLDLSVAASGLPASSLNGSASFVGRPGGPGPMTGQGTVVLDSSSLGRSAIGPGRFAVALARDTLSLNGRVQAAEGSVALAASARPFDRVPTFRVHQVRFEAVELAALTNGRIRHPLSGTLVAQGTLPPDSLPQVTGRLELDGGRFNRGQLDTLSADFELRGRQLSVQADARTGEGRLELDSETELVQNGDNGSPSWTVGTTTVTGQFDLPDLRALLGDSGAGRLAGRVHVTGQGTEVETMRWDGSTRLSGQWEQARLDSLNLEARIADGRLTIDTLRVDSNLLRGGGGGSTPLTAQASGPRDTIAIRLVSDTTAPAVLSGLFDVDPLSARVGTIRVLAWHAERNLQFRGAVHLGGLIAGTSGADSLAITAGAAYGRAGLGDLRGSLTGIRVAWNRLELERLDARLVSDSNRFTLTATATRDDQHQFELAGNGVVGEQRVSLTSFGFGFGDVRWALTDTAVVSWGERIVVSDFDLRYGHRRIVVEGTLDRQGTQNLNLQLDSVPLQRFAEFAGIDDLNATLNGTIRVDGPAARPGLHSNLTLTVESVVARLETRPSGDQLALDFDLAAGPGETLTVQGTVPNRLSLLRNPVEPSPEAEAVALQIRSAGFPVDWMTPFAQGVGIDRLAGRIQANARVEGTMARPRASGTAQFTGGRVRIPRQGIDYDEISGALALSADRLQVTTWRATADGHATVGGSLLLAPLDNPQLDLRVQFDRFRVIRNDFVRLGLTGSAAIRGTLTEPMLTGRVTLERTDFHADRVGQNPTLRPVTLTERDYQMLESYFGFRPGDQREGEILAPWGIDLDVRIGGDVWIRKDVRPEVRVLLSGSVDVRKEPGDSLQFFGTVEAVPARSTVEQFGKRFAIETGTITLNGPIGSWRVDLDARYEVPAYQDPSASEVAITLAVRGGAQDLRLTLGSEPQMETTDIVSYLATGRPSRSAADFGRADGSGRLSGQSTAFAMGALTDILEDEAGQQIGLDVMEIEQDPAQGTIIVAGRYVSPRLYVGFQQPVGQGNRQDRLDGQNLGTQVELEYSAFRWLLLNLQGGSGFRWFLRTRYAF